MELRPHRILLQMSYSSQKSYNTLSSNICMRRVFPHKPCNNAMNNRIIVNLLAVVMCLVLGQFNVPIASANLILNGSFENGPAPNPVSFYTTEIGRAYRQSPIARNFSTVGGVGVTNWSSTGYFEWMAGPDSDVPDGTACVGGYDNAGTSLLYQDGINLGADNSYTFTVDLWQVGGTGAGPSLDVRMTTGNSSDFAAPENAITLVTHETTIGSDNAIETVSVNFTPSVSDSSYAIQIQGTAEWGIYMLLDNVTLSMNSIVWDDGGGDTNWDGGTYAN